MARAAPPDYYAVLEVSDKATAQQIRDAYKRAALKSHPDRVPADSPERKRRTERFQLVNDAYYALSDAGRRQEYDTQRRLYGVRDNGRGGGASWAWDHFPQPATGSDGRQASPEEARQRTEEAQFADVFEEMMREEGMAEQEDANGGGSTSTGSTGNIWGVLGGISGGALGFIVANVPGMMAGAVAGNRLGAIRDTKGKSVYAVFQELPSDDRARLLSQLAMRVLSHTVGV
ncbi:chaperone [Grosmannia clavigera kw1407]|uniref:Chaperone n=1 Tax=Grosmannia clavigera (strain kw1407 / UAMH 11150) TaxID=655863 RepID=F0XR66_GROCL|nr:chaperone [Grosmannia clavigera kw1407]EFW99760.1 chaperone [Grosmannia clavigera kw1407]